MLPQAMKEVRLASGPHCLQGTRRISVHGARAERRLGTRGCTKPSSSGAHASQEQGFAVRTRPACPDGMMRHMPLSSVINMHRVAVPHRKLAVALLHGGAVRVPWRVRGSGGEDLTAGKANQASEGIARAKGRRVRFYF